MSNTGRHQPGGDDPALLTEMARHVARQARHCRDPSYHGAPSQRDANVGVVFVFKNPRKDFQTASRWQ